MAWLVKVQKLPTTNQSSRGWVPKRMINWRWLTQCITYKFIVFVVRVWSRSRNSEPRHVMIRVLLILAQSIKQGFWCRPFSAAAEVDALGWCGSRSVRNKYERVVCLQVQLYLTPERRSKHTTRVVAIEYVLCLNTVNVHKLASVLVIWR